MPPVTTSQNSPDTTLSLKIAGKDVQLGSGQRFNSLVVQPSTQHTRFAVVCRCDCGTTKTCNAYHLFRGKLKTCGCARKRPITSVKEGQIFGRLTVRGRLRTWGPRGVIFLCQCECGKESKVFSTRLVEGKTKSCGCLKRTQLCGKPAANRKADGECCLTDTYLRYRTGARNRKLAFDLTRDQFREITGKVCYYCGTPPSNCAKKKGAPGQYLYNGIDRLNNNEGYVLGNVEAACFYCNRAKMDQSVSQFLERVKQTYLRHNA